MKSLNPKITDWHGKRVWLLGASSGIGKALAKKLQDAGAHIALSARREEPLRDLAESEDLVLPLDVADGEAIVSAHDLLLARWGQIDLVVYLAGVYTPMRSWEIDLDAVRQGLAINLHGVYNLLAVVTPSFVEKQAGAICLVGSVAGYTGLPKALAYGPGKAALINLAQILYAELSTRGIGVYLVNPGFVATRLTQKNDFRMPALIGTEDAVEEIMKGLAKGRFEIHFPRRFSYAMKWLSRAPDRLRFALLKKAAA